MKVDKITDFIGYFFIALYALSIVTLFVLIFMGYGDVKLTDLFSEIFG